MYLHLVVPTEVDENKDSTTATIGPVNKKVYYEVGCKVLELNKIYK